MKFKFLSVVMMSALCFVGSAKAQETSDPQKETVIVDEFTRTTAVPAYLTEGIRANVIEGFVSKGRFHVVDALTNDALKALSAKRVAEDNVDASNVMNSESEAVYKSLGAKYLIKGKVTDRTVTREKDVLSDSYSWYSKISLSLTVYNILDGSTVASKNIQLTGVNSDSSEKADMNAVEDAKKEMRSFVDANFKFKTFIEMIESVDKKKGAKELYIVGGNEMGIKKGQVFKVYYVKQIGSRTANQEIGALKADEVMDGLTKCNVTKGGVEINDIFNSEGRDKLVIESAGNTREKVGGFFGF